MKRLLTTATLCVLAMIGSARAATFTVTTTADSGPGSLRDAIAQANGNPGADTIDFAVTGTITLTSGMIQITGPLTIQGPGAANLAIDGNLLERIFFVFDAASAVVCPNLSGPTDYLVSMSGLTLQNGNRRVVDSQGGGIFSVKSLALDSMVFTGNLARSGGAVTFSPQIPGQTLTITNSKFHNNFAKPTVAGNTLSYNGGALFVADFCFGTLVPATVTIDNSEFQGNRVQPDIRDGLGGAIALHHASTVTMSRVRVTNNGIDPPNPLIAQLIYSGGGVYANVKSLTIIDSEISDNHAQNSGGLSLNNNQPTLQTPADTYHAGIVNSTVSGNTAFASGGAMLLWANVAAEIHNSTIADNVAANGTSGVHFSKPSTGTWLDPTLMLSSSVLGQARGGTDDLSASAAVIPTTTVSATNSLVQRIRATSNIAVSGAGNVIGAAPLLGPLSFNGGSTRTMAMLAGSPIADTGANPLNLSTDQRGVGFPRTIGATTDMGAMEGPGLCAGFTDVQSINAFCPNVEWLKNRAITLGCSSTTVYCPTDSVTRLSMAAFMDRLGTALTPRKLAAHATPGAVVVSDATPAYFCATGDVPPATYGRAALVTTSFAGLSDGNAVAWRGFVSYSTDGGVTWQGTPTQVAARASSGGNEWSNTALSTPVPVAPGKIYRFAIGVRRDNVVTGTTGNFVQSVCQLEASVVNVNGSVPPFDSGTALDGTRW